MVGIFYICLALSLAADTVLLVTAETTPVPGNHTHHHHEQTEIENFSFHYDGTSHMLLVTANTNCYIWTLTNKQLQGVHTDDGLRAIELKVLGQIDQALYTVIPKAILASGIQNGCGRQATNFYLVH